MRRILLAVGDTATTLQAARHIRPWLRERETSLTLISVIAPGTLSPLSPLKHVLEQVEAVFTGAEEQPGIIVRVGQDPAAEICREAREGAYDLLALGLHGHGTLDGTLDDACRAILAACDIPVLITPPVLHVGMTPQVLFVVDRAVAPDDTVRWLAAQCQTQHLNAILCARNAEETTPLHDLLASVGVLSQLFLCPDLTPGEIHRLAKDRRVRWLVLPAQDGATGAAARAPVEEVLGTATCPVLIVPGAAADRQAS
ncbi:MAG: universal stress protein [Anaerolineae bacterium]|nr:universal stress protein [Anaerolineae bacterium]